MSIDHNNENQEPTEDDLYLAKMTMDEVGADIDEHGHITVTDDNRTQDPFTTKGSLANALDEALDYSNPNYDPTNESQGEVEGVTQDPQNDSPKSSNTEIKPDDTTMDKAPELPESMNNNNDKTTKDSLAEALDSVVAMDAVTEVPEETDDDTHHKWENNEIDKRVPNVPKSLDGEDDKPDENGLVYLHYVISVDPTEYQSANYRPIANAGKIGGLKGKNAGVKGQTVVTKEEMEESTSKDKVDEEVTIEEEPSPKEEKDAAKQANKEEEKDRKAEDEALESVALDFATSLDGSSFVCCDEFNGIDYSKIAMDTTPRRAPTRQTCQTTFSQCRAENPLYCRFHGPKLLETDLKTMIMARLQRQGIRSAGLVVSVEKDSNRINREGNALKFKVTVGCTPQQKSQVQGIIDGMFNKGSAFRRAPTQVPGIKLVSNPRTSERGDTRQMEAELEMDLLSADRPPRRGAEERAVDLNRQVQEPNAQEPIEQPQEQQTEEPVSQNNVRMPQQMGRPSEQDISRAALAIANANIDVLDDAYAGLTGVLNGTVQGLGDTSAEEMTRQIVEPYIEALTNEQNNGIDHSNVIRALQNTLDNLPSPQGRTEAGEVQPSDAQQEEQRQAEEERRVRLNSANADGIEHLDGGVKARFSDSEIEAITREKNRAIAESNANPSNARLRSYAHTFSSLLGSANSAYGRRNHALRGITDGITKAELLEKAEQRLERVLDAENPERFDGAVQAIQEIARLSGIDGVEVDGTRITLRNPEQQGARPPIEENGGNENQGGERVVTREELDRAFDDNGDNRVDRQTEQPQPTNREPTEAEVNEAVSALSRSSGFPEREVRNYLTAYLNGTRPIDPNYTPILNSLPEGSAVRETLNRRMRDQEARREEQQRLEQARQAEANRLMAMSIPDKSAIALKKPTSPSYVPNAIISKEEVERIRHEHESFWAENAGLEEANTAQKRTALARHLARCVQDSSIRAADDECVKTMLPNVQKIDSSSMGVQAGMINPFTSNPYPYMNCYKGAIGALIRLRGYGVIATDSATPSPAFANSDSLLLRRGENQATYKATQEEYAKVYERLISSNDNEVAALTLIAKGDPERGIAPYPDGTCVISWNHHARVNLLFKGKWFRCDPYGYDSVDENGYSIGNVKRQGHIRARYIRPVTESQIASVMYKDDKERARATFANVINTLYDRRRDNNDPRWNFGADDNNRQTVLAMAMAVRRLHIEGVSISGRAPNARRPTDEEIRRCADYLTDSGNTDYTLYNSSIVIRPQDKLIPAAVGLVKKSPEF